jgi:hypothetical protein
MRSRTPPAKLAAFEDLVGGGLVLVHFDARRAGVRVPQEFAPERHVVAHCGRAAVIPVRDLRADVDGVSGIVFLATGVRWMAGSTFVPWSAVFMLDGSDGRRTVYHEDLPDGISVAPLEDASTWSRRQAERLEHLRHCDLHARDNMGLTVADHALQRCQRGALRLLLERGALLEQVHRLAVAVVCGDFDPVRALAPLFDLDRPDRFGRTPLMYAVEVRDVAIIRYLLGRGADPAVPSVSGGNILHAAAWDADPAVIECLIRGGAVVHATDKDGDTPLLRCSRRR